MTGAGVVPCRWRNSAQGGPIKLAGDTFGAATCMTGGPAVDAVVVSPRAWDTSGMHAKISAAPISLGGNRPIIGRRANRVVATPPAPPQPQL